MAPNIPLASRSITIRFPPAPSESDHGVLEESYQLLELPAEILKQVEGGKAGTFPYYLFSARDPALIMVAAV
jgi:hypothetical protein